VIDNGGNAEFPGLNMPFNKDLPLGSSGYNVLMEQYLNNGYSSYYDPVAQGRIEYYHR